MLIPGNMQHLLEQLGLAHWCPCLHQWLAQYAGLETATVFEADPVSDTHALLTHAVAAHTIYDDSHFVDALSRLDFLCMRASANKVLWQPLEQSFAKFMLLAQCQQHTIRFWMWDTELPFPAETQRWLLERLSSPMPQATRW